METKEEITKDNDKTSSRRSSIVTTKTSEEETKTESRRSSIAEDKKKKVTLGSKKLESTPEAVSYLNVFNTFQCLSTFKPLC